MSNYTSTYLPSLTVPANTSYPLSRHNIKNISSLRKQVEHENKQKIFIINDRGFITTEIQTILTDIKSTSFNNFLAGAVRYMEEHAPTELVKQALPYFYILNDKISGFDNLDFPPLSVSLPESEELLVEWNFEHFKIGLSFETNSEESGWYIVNDGTVNKMTAWGYLNSQSEVELVDTILSQVI